MRILIIGGDGMLGHTLYQYLKTKHSVKVTLRQPYENYKKYQIFEKENVFCNIDIQQLQPLAEVLAAFKPEAVINCVGLIKQRPDKENIALNLEVNALFPHQLSLLCQKIAARLIHMSTDCVFDGKQGNYCETDLCNAEDTYGKTKFLGELHEPHTITLRTSIIGYELKNKQSLLEWVLSQKNGTIQGYTNALYSGFTTHEMARIIERVLLHYPKHHGLYHVASNCINKHELLSLINQYFELNINVLKNNEFTCFRNLNGQFFNQDFSYVPPSWETMISELAAIYKQNLKKEASCNVLR
jgi:dTDP-4-dehydrorhamnose reductase